MNRGERAVTPAGAEGRGPFAFPAGGFALGASARPWLTAREIDVLELLAEGLSTQEIGEALWISPQAVSWHLGNMYAKFQCRNRAGLVGRAFVTGLLSAGQWPPRRAAPSAHPGKSENLSAVR